MSGVFSVHRVGFVQFCGSSQESEMPAIQALQPAAARSAIGDRIHWPPTPDQGVGKCITEPQFTPDVWALADQTRSTYADPVVQALQKTAMSACTP